MNILGISAYYHDSAACLLKEGQLVAAAQEERFTRKRHDASFPKHAIEYCLKAANLKAKNIDIVAYYEKPFLKFERILESLIENVPSSYLLSLKALPVWLKQKLWLRRTLTKELGLEVPILFCNHHEAHAASAFFLSPYDEAATLTVDGVGEWSTTTWGMGKGNRLELNSEIRYPHSLGLLYSAFTQYLGFRVNSAEYKVMGLAPYGEPKYVDLIKKHLIEIFDDGSYLLNMDYFAFSYKREMIHENFGSLFLRKRRNPESKIEAFHADVARSLQAVTEEVMLKLGQHVHKKTGAAYLCLAGGVALNCVANGRLLREGSFRDLWIQPGAGDAGAALGAAFIAWHHALDKPRLPSLGDRQRGSFLGPEYDDSQIEMAIHRFGLKFSRLDEHELLEKTALLLEKQNIVGWFQGRMEFGPRALGNRSILGDARNPEMQKRMNLKIKFRESFRPFAPSVLLEDAPQYFQIHTESPYMLLTVPVHERQTKVRAVAGGDRWMSERLESIESRVPAVTHVDGSARVQTISRRNNSRFYELLRAFKERTGSPVLINTSFNVRGEPIVCSPQDAVRCFLKTDIDALSVGNYLVQRSEQDPSLLSRLRETLTKEDHFELD